METRRRRVSAILVLVLSSLSADLCAMPAPPTEKISREQKVEEKKRKKEERAANVSQAHDLVQEGQSLEDVGKLLDARNNYQDAEDIIHTKEGSAALKQVKKQIKTNVESLVTGARSDYADKHYTEAHNKLEDAQKIDPTNKVLCYNLAVVFRDEGNRSAAIDALDRCLDFLPEGKERDQWEQFRASLVTPEDSSSISPAIIPEINSVNRSLQTSDFGYYHANDASVGTEACPLLMRLEAPPSLPSLLFDKERCREMTSNQQQEAIHFLEDYLQLAAGALDLQQEQAHLHTLRSLTFLPGPDGDKVKGHFAEAQRYLEVGRYDLVIRELAAADHDLPSYGESAKALALLYRDFGDVKNAQFFLEQYRNTEPLDSDDREATIALFSNLKYDRIHYDQAIDDARAPLSEVFQAYLAFGFRTRKRFVRVRMDRVIDDLNEAIKIFPRGIEANDMVAVVNQLTDNPRLAKRSYDILWSQGQPVVFFTATKDRIEIWRDVVQISRFPQLSDPLDELGRRKSSEHEQLATREAVQSVETREGNIVLHLKSSDITITPARLGVPATEKGPLARTYANQYTKLFQRYLGVDPVKLGKEGLTDWEMVRIGFDLMSVATSIYNITNVVKLQDISNLMYYGQQTIWVASATKDIRTLLAQRQRVFQSAPLKVLPVPSSQFIFKK